MGLISSVRWVALSQAVRVGSQLVSMGVLARLLPPDSYGLMAMAMTVTNLAYLFRDLGTMVAIVQRPQVSPTLVSTLFWLNTALAAAIALLLGVGAAPIARAYGQPQLAPLVGALSLAFPISSLGAVQQALLERDARFRVLARIEAVSALCALSLALALAWCGAGVWSLVAQMLVATALTTVQSMRALPWRPCKVFALDELRSIFGFSAHFSLFQYVNYLERNADSVIIGAALGPGALGVYAIAAKVMLFPMQNITGVATRALFPAMSRHQGAREQLGRLYLRATRSISTVSAPLMAGLFFLREPFVALLLGPRWSGAAPVLKWLAAAGFIQAITASTGAVFMALGKTRLLLMLGVLGAALQVAAFLIGVRWGIEGVAASFLAANLLNLLPALAIVVSMLRIAPRAALRDIGTPVAAAGFMLLVLWLAQAGGVMALAGRATGFALCIVIGAIAYAFALLVLLQQDLSDMRALLRTSWAKP
ncbi:MAG: oligosaccharide flippase family protein [Pseudomonadota bacterium]